MAIIGAGFSGTTVAIHLRRMLPPDHSILLFDQTGRFARGLAYAARDVPYLLNVRSANMSALPDDPEHFQRWLDDQASEHTGSEPTSETGTFASRGVYGRYLRALLFAEMTRSGGQVRLCADRATSLAPHPDGWRIGFAGGRTLTVAAVVLAMGNLPPPARRGGVVFHDPWQPEATADLRQDEPVLIVGTGLTMVDLALTLHAKGFDGPIIALSRRGLVPQPHAAPQAPVPFEPLEHCARRSLTDLLRAIRRRVRQAAVGGADWRAVLDGLRPETDSIWRELPPRERQRFLRHLRPYWDVHRHRMAPAVATAFRGLLDRGVVTVTPGRVRCVMPHAGQTGPVARVEIQKRGHTDTETLLVQRVLHATGFGPQTVRDDLIAGLIASGQARMDPHGIGLDVTDGLQLKTAGGGCVPGVWALSPLVRGVFWECTAVPDIRLQAQTIAREITRALSPSPKSAAAKTATPGQPNTARRPAR